MKRIWISLALILVMAALATWHVVHLTQLTSQLTDLLTQAEQQVRQGDWAQAEALTREAQEQWDAHAFYFHATMHHEDIDAVLISFHEVLAYLEGQEQQPAEYAAANSRLMTQIALLLEGELPSFKNLL